MFVEPHAQYFFICICCILVLVKMVAHYCCNIIVSMRYIKGKDISFCYVDKVIPMRFFLVLKHFFESQGISLIHLSLSLFVVFLLFSFAVW